MSKSKPVPGMIAGNSGEPILLPEVHIDGVAAESVAAGASGKIFTRLAISSGEAGFHTIAEGLGRLVVSYANGVGVSFSLERSGTIVLLIREDKSAELWVDTAAMSLNIIVKRPIQAGQAVFQTDIADIVGMSFPCLEIRDTDSLVVLFRKDWGFGLYFDFNPDKNLDREIASRELGRLYRVLAYRHLYETMADAAVVDRLIASGWFPFVEIIGDEFRNLAEHCTAGFPMEDSEAALVAAFDDSRLDNLLERWRARPHFAAKMPLLEAALKHFRADEPIAAIKIAITEIEGVLRSAYANASVQKPKIRHLLDFAIESAVNKSGAGDTLLLPEAFARYLDGYTFARFDPARGTTHAGSRHAVGHGAADVTSFTKARALQVLLTLDQLAFYT
jgi:hypothetical protein